MALVIEVLIVISLVASEVLEHHETKPAPAAPITVERGVVEGVEAPSGLTVVPYAEAPRAFPTPASPRLIALQPASVGSVVETMAEIMQPGRGKVEIADVFAAYADACETRGKRPISANEFPQAIAALCEQLNIKIADTKDGVFLMRVKVIPLRPEGRGFTVQRG